MSLLLCGSDSGLDKENVRPRGGSRSKVNTLQCAGLQMIPETTTEPVDMEAITLVIKRGKTGFGFSVTGANPARVRRVEEGSTSYLAGLRQEDRVKRINGQNVAKSIADSVAKIVRQSEKQIVLDIERVCIEEHDNAELTKSNDGTKGQPKVPPRKPLGSLMDSSDMNIDDNKVVCTADIEQRPDSLSSLESLQICAESLISLGDWSSSHLIKDSFPPLVLSYKELSEAEQGRQVAINKLCQCEKDFVAKMHSGIQQFCEPLKISLISPAEHGTLFQNIEKLVAMSEYHVAKMTEEAMGYTDAPNQADKFIDAIGSVYLTKVVDMASEFEQYCNGIKNAFRLLAELKEFKEFNDFLKESSSGKTHLTVTRFIQKPLEHIKDVVLNLQRVLALTPLDHQDTDSLSEVVENLRHSCNVINEKNTRRSHSMTSLVSSSKSSSRRGRSSPCGSSSSGPSSSLSSDSSNSSIESSVDPAVMDVQRRLCFCDHVQTFQLATATRHMIYGGELMYVEGLLCTRLYVALMNDLLILTKLEPDDRLLVVDHPILLKDVINADFRDNNTLDFCLTVESPIDEDWVEERDVTLRAPSMEQKFTWKNILEQRTVSCKSHQDFMNMDNFV